MAFPKRYQTSTAPSPREPKAAKASRPSREQDENARPSRSASDKVLIALLISAAFFASYGYALNVREQRLASSSPPSQTLVTGTASAAPAPAGNLDPQAKVVNGVQTVYIDASGGFNPQTIFAKPGIPVKIKFGPGQGCTAAVQFPQFNIYKDLTQGGAEVDLPALKPGQYQFSCGMQMVFGLLVVR